MAKAWKKTAVLRRQSRPIYTVAVSENHRHFAQGCVYDVDESDGTNVMRGTAASGGNSTPYHQPIPPRPGGSMVRGSSGPGPAEHRPIPCRLHPRRHPAPIRRKD